MHYYVYVLYSLKDKKFYVGSSRNIKIRVESHFKGKVRSTVNRRPLKLILYECFFDKEDALKRERSIKHWTRKYKLKLIEGFSPEKNL